MLLEGKNAVIYGAAGSIGGAAARAFAREGARVFLAGRTLATLGAVAEEIRSTGGAAETAEVDALDEAAVDTHADAVAADATAAVPVTLDCAVAAPVAVEAIAAVPDAATGVVPPPAPNVHPGGSSVVTIAVPAIPL